MTKGDEDILRGGLKPLITSQRTIYTSLYSVPKAPPPSPINSTNTIHSLKSSGKNSIKPTAVIPRLFSDNKTLRAFPISRNCAKCSNIRYASDSSERKCTRNKPVSLYLDRILYSKGSLPSHDNPSSVTNCNLRNVVCNSSPSVNRIGLNLNDNERSAAVSLLDLKECSSQVTNMIQTWSKSQNVPLCDFIVAQKKCETMLDNLNLLKEGKIHGKSFYGTVNDVENGKIPVKSGRKEDKSSKQKLLAMLKDGYKQYEKNSSFVISIVDMAGSDHNEGSNLIRRADNSQLERTESYVSSSGSSSSSISKKSSSKCDASENPTKYMSNKCGIVTISSDIGGSDQHKRQYPVKFGKSSKSGKNRNTHLRCLHCSAVDTPEWRKGPGGPATLCNACGLFYKKLSRKFGILTAGTIMRLRRAKNPQDRKVPRNRS